MAYRKPTKTSYSRVWLLEDGAKPGTTAEYMGLWKAGAPSWDFGESTAIEGPSSDGFGLFEELEDLPGEKSKPSISLVGRYPRDLSDMLRLARRECYHDFQIHFGACGSPLDYAGGWEKIVAVEHARISNYSSEDLGALESGENAAINETIQLQSRDYYEIKQLSMAEVAAASVIQEVIGIVVCDAKSCGGECGTASSGCQKVFALVKAVGGSPGLGSQVLYTEDSGANWSSSQLTTLAANVEPSAIACAGNYVVVVSADDESHHYALREEILDGIETWTEVTGYTADKGPRAIFALRPTYIWVVGEAGYVYFLEGATDTPTVQDAGSATAQNLNDVHAYDEEHVIAVGDSNAVIYTTDGATWSSVTGPAVGVNLNCCWMIDESTWLVGTAGGELYYTANSGLTWTAVSFSGSGAGQVRDIYFPTRQVGYLAHDTATPAGRIFRTIDGGNTWTLLPEGTGSIPANDRINALAACEANLVFGGGLADDASDGIIVKGS